VYRVIHETSVPAASLRPQLPAGMSSLLARMLDKNPQARPDARALVNALHALAPASPQVPAPQPSNRISRLLPMLAFGTPVAVFLLIGVGIIVIEHFLVTPWQAEPPLTQKAVSQTATGAAPGSQPSAAQAEPAPSLQKQALKSDAYLAGLDKKQVELRIKRTELLLQYTEQHPDVVQIDRQLEQLRIERRRYLRQSKKN
jgi:serine/threonine-protein kinase